MKEQANKRKPARAKAPTAAKKVRASADAVEKKTGFKFPVGNQYWQTRAKHGRDGIWSTPDDLLADCIGYFEWLEKNPLFEDKISAYQGVVTHEAVAKMRAATLDGLQIHLGITDNTWRNYRANPDFFRVVEYTEKAIRQQKFAGAAADLLNANIIARDLGLRDNVQAEHTGKDGGPIRTETTLTPSEAYLLMLGQK